MTLRGLLLLVLLAAAPVQDPAAAPPVDFERDIRPILSDTCSTCHGPDPGKRKADLRLDTREGAFAEHEGRKSIVPGRPDQSELYRRLTTADAEDRMPPRKSGRAVSPAQIELVRRWIVEGAPWKNHWAFVAPKPAELKIRNPRWRRNPIDDFVLERLIREGLAPSPEADRTTLLRRVSLDLTGLPPTPEEVDAFLADAAPDAYEKAVDRLLASPRYGERMAVRWLDAARYADTSGYQSDGPRDMWRWRDWVIEAFNANMPFDRFTVEQLAGDLLPEARLDQRIATGFNRNHRGNSEGGIVPEEYQVEYVVDRVDTTATVWLGLTIGCARCHSHKYDPISQDEFYRLYAYFNTIPEHGRAIKIGNSPPLVQAPTPDQVVEGHRLDESLAAAEKHFAELQPELAAAQAAWEKSPGNAVVPWTVTDGARPTEGKDAGKFGFFDKFTLAASVRPEGNATGTLLSRMDLAGREEGYSLHLEAGRVHVNFVKRWLDDAIRVETVEQLSPGRHHVAATYDGSRLAAGITIFIDGAPQKLKVNLDFLNQSFVTEHPFRIGTGISPFSGAIDDVRIYGRQLSTEEIGWIANTDSAQAGKLAACFLERYAPEPIRKAQQDLIALRRKVQAFRESLPSVMVMEEMKTPRETHVLIRGEYNRPGRKVEPGVPAALHPLPPGAAPNRLALARWIVDPANPLTARVIVNQWWQMYFGSGLVRTIEDFGAQGERPTHPELLDWLAAELVRTSWDVKRLQKTIVSSATYRQSSRVTAALLERDPDNRLLARGPRFRLSAEMVRDQALAASGLLVERLGGPSVKPYQPEGLWKEIASDTEYDQAKGEGLYRRSLYTYWKRTVAPPTMSTFDASGREACTVRQTRTNTPTQALALLNDVTYIEAARALAQRMLLEGGFRRGFRRVVLRLPTAREEEILNRAFRRNLERFRRDPDAARRLISVGDSKPDPALDAAELAAMTTVASLILNLDEALTKE
jgi:hypothetical protein